MLGRRVQSRRTQGVRRATTPRHFAYSLEALERRRLLSQTVPLNVQVTSDPGVQQQPSLVVDPRDPQHVVIAYMDRSLVTTGYSGIGVSVSDDGGKTWSKSPIPLPAGFDQGAATPIAKFDDQGHLYVSFMAATFLGSSKPALTNPDAAERTDGFESNNGIFVVRSDDDGLTWGTPVAVASNLYDGKDPVLFDTVPDLAIDSFRNLPNGKANPNYGAMYESWTQLYPAGQFPGDSASSGGGAIMFAISTNGGQSWQLRLQPQAGTGVPVTVIGPNDPFFTGEAPPGLTGQTDAQISVGPEGDVYVAYYMFGTFAVIHSSDAGRSFSSINQQTSSGVPFNVGIYMGSATAATSNGGPDGAGGPTNDFRTLPLRDIVADPTRPGTLYVAEVISTPNTNGAVLDYGDIFFARSTDYGVTWTSSFDVGGKPAAVLNDDNGGQITTGASMTWLMLRRCRRWTSMARAIWLLSGTTRVTIRRITCSTSTGR